MASGQGSHWLIESPTIFNLFVTDPPEICVNLVFKHTLLAVTQSVDNVFHSMIVLSEKDYLLISNLQ